MDTRSRKNRHMLLSNPKPIKHDLLENYYIEKKAEIISDSRKTKRQNPYKKWSILAVALSLLLIITAWYAFSPQQEDASKITAQASSSPSTDSSAEPEPTDFTDLGNQQTDQHLDPATDSKTTNQPSPKKQNNSTESTPKKPPETNVAPKSSTDRPSRPTKQTDQKKPAEPTNPPPSQAGNKPKEEKKPECKPSIWNLFRCN
jgi:hypothetical protein